MTCLSAKLYVPLTSMTRRLNVFFLKEQVQVQEVSWVAIVMQGKGVFNNPLAQVASQRLLPGLNSILFLCQGDH